MSREILFHGKRVDNGEWVISDSIMQIKEQNPRLWVEFDGWVEVIPETVGQFTGLTDKNGKKIFENGYIIIDNKTYKVTFNNAEYILTNIFNCDTITLKNNSIRGVFVDEIWSNKKI